MARPPGLAAFEHACTETIRTVAGRPDVRLLSFRQFVEWREVQDRSALRKLRTPGVGRAPAGGLGVLPRPGRLRPRGGTHGPAESQRWPSVEHPPRSRYERSDEHTELRATPG
ncbi:hypothetical protein ACFVXQ_29310, partial [Kitasatospora sp. NPDC058263]